MKNKRDGMGLDYHSFLGLFLKVMGIAMQPAHNEIALPSCHLIRRSLGTTAFSHVISS